MSEALQADLDRNFWRNKKVFLTGHTGFKGSWLSLWLQTLGSHVRGYSLYPPTQPNLFEAANVAEGMDSLQGDVRDSEKLKAAVCDFRPEIVLHLAAQPLVRRSYKEPLETLDTNILGTARLLDAVRNVSSVRAVLVITTDKCYRNKEWEYGYRESDDLGGNDPYSSSKACAELVVSAYRSSYFQSEREEQGPVAVATARAGNVIGGGDWAEDRLIPDLVASFMHGKTVMIRNPQATRPWQHVLEALNGYLILAERLFCDGLPFASAFNFGPTNDDCRSVEFIVREVQSLWGDNASYKIIQTQQPNEANFLKLDSSKARKRLGWRPRWNISQALEKTVSWYKFWTKNKNNKGAMRAFTVEQIASYVL